MRKILAIILCFFLSAGAAYAVLPPDIYQKWIDNSEIKAVAVVERVEITSWENSIQYKKVHFKLIKGFTSNIPERFVGHCKSFKPRFFWDPKEPMAGGTIYQYPDKGEEAFVTVSSDGGHINSYDELTLDLKEEINKNGLKNLIIGPFGIVKK